ncbi:EamA family transporter [Shimazuella sp. AN120528]|uniref:EamA family transporter n=1 Tax=Shimazuella soli TaxID=1892854 RepID=UPI001F11144F|nr:EamA family transporter [Shimazuella soli]MCH5585778.1 EamA family transporter [Shimazuella soli]
MTGYILSLLLISALGHAGWNAISKQVTEKDTFFTIIIGLAVILYLPLAIYLLLQQPIPWEAYFYMAGSTICELIYFWGLAHAYRQLPFSYAYPIVRGLGPLVSTFLSFFLGAALTWIGFGGILLVVAGILLMQFSGKFTLETGAGWAFLAGAINGGAITFDSMGAAMMSGMLFKYIVFIGILLGKMMMDRISFREYKRVFLLYKGKAVVGALLTFGANAVTQFALQSTPVGYVSATRELSIAFGTLIGWLFFKEELKKNHYIGIGILILGILLIKLGG